MINIVTANMNMFINSTYNIKVLMGPLKNYYEKICREISTIYYQPSNHSTCLLQALVRGFLTRQRLKHINNRAPSGESKSGELYDMMTRAAIETSTYMWNRANAAVLKSKENYVDTAPEDKPIYSMVYDPWNDRCFTLEELKKFRSEKTKRRVSFAPGTKDYDGPTPSISEDDGWLLIR